MLNISDNQLNKKVSLSKYNSFKKISRLEYHKYFNWFLIGSFLIFVLVLFLPWTQNVNGRGSVTTLKPNQRPQSIQSQIPGRIEEWYIREGDYVTKGDTILRLSEIKTEYQDPQLVDRTVEQRDAKAFSATSYGEKIQALNNQLNALSAEQELKISQATNKIEQLRYSLVADSTDLEALKNNLEIAERQYERIEQLEKEGLKSLTDVEQKRLKFQEVQAKKVAQQNKVLTTKNKLANALTEVSRIRAQYSEKIAKVRSDIATANSALYETKAQVAKLDNQSTNYAIRKSLYYVTAPQNGYINKTIKSGVGETVKEGGQLAGIMPAEYDIAVETYIEPTDLPLVNIGEEVRLQFDGWPSIFFSGWPNASYGTFAGKIVVVETFISPNGKFRILIAPDEEEQEWPKNLRVGTGAYTVALLKDVPIWYELWRKLNGFPPDYYGSKQQTKSETK